MNLEFFIKLREMVSSGLIKMASTANKTSASIKGVNGTLAQSYDTIRTKIGQLESAISKSTSISHIRQARRELEQLQRLSMRAPGNTAGGGGGFFAGMFRQALPALGFAGALAMGGSVIGAGLDAQARQTSFEVMAGKEQGTALNKDLTKYAQDSIYGNEVYQNAQTMMAFGIAPKEVMGDMKMLGDIAMGNKDRMSRLALAYSQVAAAGKLMGQDLLQFVNAGFNPLQVISEKTGVSLGVLRKRVEEGQVSFEHVKAAFESATSAGGRFFEMTEKIQKTDFGKWEAFKGQVQGLAMQIGGALAPAFGNLVTWMSESLKWIQENWSWLSLLVGVVGGAIVAYQSVILVTQLWTAAQGLLNAAMMMNPIGLLIGAIAALVVGVVWAWNHFEGFRKTIYSVWEVMKLLWGYIHAFIKPGLDGLVFQFQILKFIVSQLWDVFKVVFDKIGDYFMVVFGPMIAAIKWLWNAAATSGLGNEIAAAWNRGQGGNGASITWDATSPTAVMPGGNTMADVFGSLKGASAGDDGGVTRGITGGGPRVVNINGVKFTEKIEIHSNTVGESIDDLETKLQEMFLRVLNSGAALQ
jgi:tape measure domain-containing protein